jgi:Tol biopolymer transport system component
MGGRYVAYVSSATNLVSGDSNGVADVFVRDRQAGTTERVSVDSSGKQADGACTSCAISSDGRFVAFASVATNLVSGDTNGTFDVFVRDRQNGTTGRVSVDSSGGQGDAAASTPRSPRTGCSSRSTARRPASSRRRQQGLRRLCTTARAA